MKRSNLLNTTFWATAFLLCLAFQSVYSQSITYQNPSEFFACDGAEFSFTVQNTSGNTLANAVLTVNFTTTNGTACGFSYALGSVTGQALESNLSNLSAPQFSLANIAPGASQSFSIQVEADCQTAACIDNAEVFVNNITLTWDGGSTNITTNPYVVDRALLVFTNVSSTVMSGSRGDVLQRKFTIRNTRPGAISNFVFQDQYQPGLVVSSMQGTPSPAQPGVFETTLGAADFASIGDGDGLFEFNEVIIVTEDITITGCGVDESSSVSNITASWGCGGDVCQQENVNAVVSIKLNDKVPQLAWEPIISSPQCFCGPNGYEQGMKITNVGTGEALDLRFEMGVLPNFTFGWVDTNSVHLDSLGINVAFDANFSTIPNFENPCDGPQGLASGFNLTIASLKPGASVTIFWDGYFCELSCSGNRANTGWQYRYSYFKECPPSIFFQNSNFIPVSDENISMNTWGSFGNPTEVMEDGETQTITYNLAYDSLHLLNNQLIVDIDIPCGYVWDDDNELLLGGSAPLSINYVPGNPNSTVTAIYQLPLNNDTASMDFDLTFFCDSVCTGQLDCNYELQTSCPDEKLCILEILPALSVLIETNLMKCPDYPPSCNPSSCLEVRKGYDCPTDSTCVDAPPGYLRFDMDLVRKNYGLPDNNNDQIADALTGTPDLSLVERKRFIAGDTIQATINGVVVIDQPGATLPFASMSISFNGGQLMTDANRDSLFRADRLKAAGSLLRIFDNSAGVWYECANPPFSTSGKLVYTYELTQLVGTCLPANFAFDHGDSLIFVGNYRIGYNPQFENGNPTPLLGDIVVNSEVLLFDENADDYTLLDCHCGNDQLLLSYYQFRIIPGTFGVLPCEPTPTVTGSLLDLRLHEGNFFPFEHRNIMTINDFLLTLDPSVQLDTTRMTYLRLQDGPQLASQVYFPPNPSNGTYFHNLSQFQTPPLDEGFSAYFQFTFQNACTNKFSLVATHGAWVDFYDGLPEPNIPVFVDVQSNAIRPLIANLAIDAPLFNLVSLSNQMEFDFKLKNTPTVASSLNSGPAPNTWMYITSQTGMVTGFQLIDQTTGLPVPAINGVWQLGDLPVNPDGFPYRIVATNNSCEIENLQLHYGWNCDPFLSTVQSPCYELVRPLTIESPPGEIDILVDSPLGCSQLCDTIPYHTIEVFNAQLGSVYNLRLKALVPPGMDILPGSTVVEYPTGSGLLYPIGDPTVLGTGVVEWNLSMLFDSIANGLPGVTNAPYNSLTLKFLGQSTCDFIADAYVLFIAAAEQNCGTPTNSIAKPGDPLCIEGVSSTYTTSISVNAVPGYGCNDVVTYEVSLSATDTLPPGASFIATLPPGITYVPGSCANQCSTPFNCAPTINGSQVTWQLPAGVFPTQLVCFKFNTQGWSNLDCENGVVLFRTAAETQALCALTGDSCSTNVSTGSLILPFDIQRPDFELNNFTINVESQGNNLISLLFQVEVTNNGAASQPPVTVSYYQDWDGDGVGDNFLSSISLFTTVGSGETITMYGGAGQIPDTINLCQIIAVIDPALQCVCASDVEQVGAPIIFDTGQNWTVCSGTDLPVGVAEMPGFDYQWSPADCLADPQAAMTIFNCVNDGIAPAEYQFTLAEGNGFCEIQNLMGVTVQPVPGIAYVDSPICQGESANLAATDGVSFNWQGPGIVQPNLQIQTVTPASTSTYSVTVSDAFGCTGTDMATVVVAPLPTVSAGQDESYCPGESAQLNASFDPDFDYLWSPQIVGGQPALSDPTIHDPQVLTGQTTIFTLTVLDENGCSAMDAVTVSFADTLLLTMPPDVTICTGSSATLNVVSNVPANFTWSPNGTCLNPPSCSSLLVTPTSTTTYSASAASTDGCLANGVVTVTVVNDQILTNGPTVEICEGETAVINGEVVFEPGIYCDTFTVAGGCDSLYCVELLVKPGMDTLTVADTICLGESVVFEGETFSTEGLHCVTFIAENGCDSTRCLLLTVNDLPTVTIIGLDTVSAGDTLVMTLEPTGITGGIFWFANDSLLADCTDATTCAVFPMDSVTYSVQLTDPDTGCSGNDELAVTVIPACNPEKVAVPNAFSPNNDQLNDVFDIVGPGSEAVLNMRIWNRWGQKVYDGPGPWDGMQNGKRAGSDVYIYAIKVGCAVPVEDLEKVLKGDVTLLR